MAEEEANGKGGKMEGVKLILLDIGIAVEYRVSVQTSPH